MNKLVIKNYNFGTTLLGGQAFNWDFINESYYGFLRDTIIKLTPKSDVLLWQTYPESDNEELIKKYLNVDEFYDEKLEKIKKKDKYIKSAIDKYKGLRILNQDFEQTLLSFILSSHKSIKGVRKAVRDLSKAYGQSIVVDGYKFHLFPRSEVLRELSEGNFREIGFGFRAKYFKKALIKLKNRLPALDQKRDELSQTGELRIGLGLSHMEEDVRNYLMSFDGIGEKIADCIMTFSLGFNNVTPLDIWGKRVLTDFYKVNPKLKYSEMREWYQSYFGENTAIAGQYLFEHIRANRGDR